MSSIPQAVSNYVQADHATNGFVSRLTYWQFAHFIYLHKPEFAVMFFGIVSLFCYLAHKVAGNINPPNVSSAIIYQAIGTTFAILSAGILIYKALVSL